MYKHFYIIKLPVLHKSGMTMRKDVRKPPMIVVAIRRGPGRSEFVVVVQPLSSPVTRIEKADKRTNFFIFDSYKRKRERRK
jgi:hypothetical protein